MSPRLLSKQALIAYLSIASIAFIVYRSIDSVPPATLVNLTITLKDEKGDLVQDANIVVDGVSRGVSRYDGQFELKQDTAGRKRTMRILSEDVDQEIILHIPDYDTDTVLNVFRKSAKTQSESPIIQQAPRDTSSRRKTRVNAQGLEKNSGSGQPPQEGNIRKDAVPTDRSSQAVITLEVIDEQRNGIPDATIEIADKVSGTQQQKYTTDSNGRVSARLIRSTLYQIDIEKAGYDYFTVSRDFDDNSSLVQFIIEAKKKKTVLSKYNGEALKVIERYMADGRWATALSIINTNISSEEPDLDNDVEVRTYTSILSIKAIAHYNLGNYDSAVSVLMKLTSSYEVFGKYSGEAYYWLGLSRFAKSNYSGAISAFEKAMNHRMTIPLKYREQRVMLSQYKIAMAFYYMATNRSIPKEQRRENVNNGIRRFQDFLAKYDTEENADLYAKDISSATKKLDELMNLSRAMGMN